jgi:hypothetical protein
MVRPAFSQPWAMLRLPIPHPFTPAQHGAAHQPQPILPWFDQHVLIQVLQLTNHPRPTPCISVIKISTVLRPARAQPRSTAQHPPDQIFPSSLRFLLRLRRTKCNTLACSVPNRRVYRACLPNLPDGSNSANLLALPVWNGYVHRKYVQMISA